MLGQKSVWGLCVSCSHWLPVVAYLRHPSCPLQKHNEEKLNKAYDASKAVYLIFSVNGRGSFQGWARMSSRITYGQVQSCCQPQHLFKTSWLCPCLIQVLVSKASYDLDDRRHNLQCLIRFLPLSSIPQSITHPVDDHGIVGSLLSSCTAFADCRPSPCIC